MFSHKICASFGNNKTGNHQIIKIQQIMKHNLKVKHKTLEALKNLNTKSFNIVFNSEEITTIVLRQEKYTLKKTELC